MGNIDLTALQGQWDLLDQLAPRMNAVDERVRRATTTMSDRLFDEAQPMGTDVYINARQLINASLDNLRCLRQLLTTYGVTPWAPWVLLRGAFEASVLAIWLLDPDDGLERRRRALRRAVDDRRQWAAWQETFAREDPDAFQQFTDELASAKRRHRDIAGQLGLDEQHVNARPNLVIEIPRLRVVREIEDSKPEFYAALWRSLSGMTHGFPYAAVANTVEHLSEPRPGGFSQIRSIDEKAWNAHAVASLLFALDAIQLYCERSMEVTTLQKPRPAM